MYINNAVEFFNDQIKKIVAECQKEGMRIHFVDVEEAFEGHEAYSSDPWITGVTVGTNIFGPKSEDLDQTAIASAYSMHPNEKGAQAYARCVNAKIAKIEEMKSLFDHIADADLSINFDTTSGIFTHATKDLSPAEALTFIIHYLRHEANSVIDKYLTYETLYDSSGKPFLDSSGNPLKYLSYCDIPVSAANYFAKMVFESTYDFNSIAKNGNIHLDLYGGAMGNGPVFNRYSYNCFNRLDNGKLEIYVDYERVDLDANKATLLSRGVLTLQWTNFYGIWQIVKYERIS